MSGDKMIRCPVYIRCLVPQIPTYMWKIYNNMFIIRSTSNKEKDRIFLDAREQALHEWLKSVLINQIHLNCYRNSSVDCYTGFADIGHVSVAVKHVTRFILDEYNQDWIEDGQDEEEGRGSTLVMEGEE
jgi:hypothetical protein